MPLKAEDMQFIKEEQIFLFNTKYILSLKGTLVREHSGPYFYL